MKIAYLDTIAGIAGDMTMAAFLHAGVSLDELSHELSKLPVDGFELQARHVQRSAIDALHCEVIISEPSHHHRHLNDILSIIDSSSLTGRTKERAKSIFAVIAEAEARIHNVPLERVHFHEVGALDSIVDIVGTAVCIELLGIERLYSSPVRLGSGGFVRTQHGTMPTPTPAALEILKHYPTVLTAVDRELTTPTGAGIIKALSSGVLDTEQISVDAIGYGAGTQELRDMPNLLRVIIGQLQQGLEQDAVVVVETNIDDMNPQVYPSLIEKLLAAGAHDAYLVPIIMKKGRPGILLSIMTPKSQLKAIVDLTYAETTTIGLRIQEIGRKKLPREEIHLKTSFGTVRAKTVFRDNKRILLPEYEECRRIAGEHNLPVLEVLRILEREFADKQQ